MRAEGAMAVRRLIAAGSFGPEEIAAMTAAFDAACTTLRLNSNDDPVTELLAKAIVTVAGTGELDPATIANRAIHALGIKQPSEESRAKTREAGS
jgi:hypothetical protein